MDSDSSESSTVPQVKPKQKRPAPAKALEALAKARQVRFEKKVAAMEAKKAEKEKMAQAVAVCTLPKEEPPVAAPAPVTEPPAPPAQAPAAPDPLAELTKRLDALLTATPPKPVKKTARIRKPVESSSSEEEVVAFVEPIEGRSVDIDALGRYLRQHLAPYKVPSSIQVLPRLPASGTGKVLKSVLIGRLSTDA